jgi:hypothetical protein
MGEYMWISSVSISRWLRACCSPRSLMALENRGVLETSITATSTPMTILESSFQLARLRLTISARAARNADISADYIIKHIDNPIGIIIEFCALIERLLDDACGGAHLIPKWITTDSTHCRGTESHIN